MLEIFGNVEQKNYLGISSTRVVPCRIWASKTDGAVMWWATWNFSIISYRIVVITIIITYILYGYSSKENGFMQGSLIDDAFFKDDINSSRLGTCWAWSRGSNRRICDRRLTIG